MYVTAAAVGRWSKPTALALALFFKWIVNHTVHSTPYHLLYYTAHITKREMRTLSWCQTAHWALSRISACSKDVDKYPRTTYEYGNHVHICVYSYSTVDVIKQRNMVNSGVRGTKDKNLRSRCIGKLL